LYVLSLSTLEEIFSRWIGVLNNTCTSENVVPPRAQVTARTEIGVWLYSCGVSLAKYWGHISKAVHWYDAPAATEGNTKAHVGFMEQILEGLSNKLSLFKNKGMCCDKLRIHCLI